jgi:hypothetical protein
MDIERIIGSISVNFVDYGPFAGKPMSTYWNLEIRDIDALWPQLAQVSVYGIYIVYSSPHHSEHQKTLLFLGYDCDKIIVPDDANPIAFRVLGDGSAFLLGLVRNGSAHELQVKKFGSPDQIADFLEPFEIALDAAERNLTAEDSLHSDNDS